MKEFKFIDTPLLLNLTEGHYNIWITGGLSVRLPNGFQINIIGKTDLISASVHEHKLKVRDFNCVNFFRVDIPKSDKYKILLKIMST